MLTAQDLQNLLPEFINHLISTNSSRSTIKNYAADLRRLLDKLPADLPIDSNHLDQSLNSLRSAFSEATIRRFSYSLKAFTLWLTSQGHNLAPAIVKPQFSIEPAIPVAPITDTNTSEDIKVSPIQTYVAHIKAEGAPEKTARLYGSDLNNFFTWLKPAGSNLNQRIIDKVSRIDINRYISFLRSRQASPATINRYLYSLKDFFNFSKADIVYDTNPVTVTRPGLVNNRSGFLQKLKGRIKKPRWWHAYRGHPISDYINWAALAAITLFIGLGLFQQLFVPKTKEIDLAQLKNGLVLAATPPRILSFQGRLTSNTGIPVTASTNVVFRIWDHVTNATEVACDAGGDENCMWKSKTWTVTPDSNGIFSVQLGDTGQSDTAIPATLFSDNASLYLGIVAGATAGWPGNAETLSPRQRIASSTYALNSDSLDGIDSTGFVQIEPAAAQGAAGTTTLIHLDENGGSTPDLIDLKVATASQFKVSNGGNMTLTGTINTNTFTSTALTFSGAAPAISASTAGTNISLNANTTGKIQIASISTGDVEFAGGFGSSGCTITTAGALSCNGAITGTGGGYLAKDLADTSTAVSAGSNLYYFQNSSTTTASNGLLVTTPAVSSATPTITGISGTTGTLSVAGTQNAFLSTLGIISAGTANAYNVSVGSPTGGTVNGFNFQNVSTTNASVNAINIGTESKSGSGTATAINIGTGWDTILSGTTAGTNLIGFSNFSVTTAGLGTFASNVAVNGGTITSTGTLTLDATSTVIIPAADTFQTDDVTSTGALSLVSAAANNINVNPGTTGDIVFTHGDASQFAINSTPTADTSQDSVKITLDPTITGSTNTLQGLVISQSDNANTGVYDSLLKLENLKTPETTANGLYIQHNAASGTLSNGIQLTNTAGTFSTGINFTGTFGNLIAATNFTVSNAGAITAATTTNTLNGLIISGGAVSGGTALTSSGTITFSGFTLNGGVIWSNASGVLAQTAVGGAGECLKSNAGGAPTFGACGGGSQTPWAQDIDAANYDLTNLGNIEFNNDTLLAGTSVYIGSDNTGDLSLNALTGRTVNLQVNGADEYNFSSTGLEFNSNNITGLGTNLTATAGITIASAGAGNDITLDGADQVIVNDNAVFNTDVDMTFAGTENLAITSDLGGTVNAISLIGTPSASASSTQGLFIQQANSANTNGLDVGIKIDNADTDLALTTGISLTNTGGGKFTTGLDIAGAYNPIHLDATRTTIAVSEAGILVDGTITKDATTESFYALSNMTTVNIDADPGTFGGDLTFRDAHTTIIDSAINVASGSTSFFTDQTLRVSGANIGTRTITNNSGSASSINLENTGSGTTTLTLTNYNGFLAAAHDGTFDGSWDANTTVTNYSGFYMANANKGSGALTNQFGLYLENLTSGTNNYGICFDCDGTYNSAVAANGITWGTDANAVTLYRSANDVLKTDDKAIIAGVNAASGSADALTLSGTLGDFDGSDTFRGLYVNYTNGAEPGAGSNIINGIDIAGITGRTNTTETALNIGTGWDTAISAGGSVLATGTFGIGTGAIANNKQINLGRTFGSFAGCPCYGTYLDLVLNGTSLTSLTGNYTKLTLSSAGQTLANTYGDYIDTTVSSAGTITTNTGLYIASQTAGGTSDYGIQIAGADTAGICFDCDGTYSYTTVGAGIQWGNDANAVSLYRNGNLNLTSNATTLSFASAALTVSSCSGCGGGGGTLQQTYDAGAVGDQLITLDATQDSIVITNPTSAGTDSAFTFQINQNNTTAAVLSLDLVQASNAANGVNLTANAIDGETALAITANGLTGGKGLTVASSAIAFTGALQELTLSGSNAANTGNLIKLSNTGALNTGALALFFNAGTGSDIQLTGTDTTYSIDLRSTTTNTLQIKNTNDITSRANVEIYGRVIKKGFLEQTSLTGITDVFVYDTTRDSDNGRWTDQGVSTGLSWYTETKDDGVADLCVNASDDRCGTSQFPQKAIIVSTGDAVYIFSANGYKLWMKFGQNAAGWALGVDTNNNPNSVSAVNGVIYVATNGASGSGLYAIDFVTDRLYRYNTTDRNLGDKNIANRNTAVGYTVQSVTTLAIADNLVNDVSAAIIQGGSALQTASGPLNGGVFIAAATDTGFSVINLQDKKTFDIADNAGDDYNSIVLTKRGRVYALNENTDNLERYGAQVAGGINIDWLFADSTSATPTWTYDETVTNKPNIAATTVAVGTSPDALEVIERASLADEAGDLIYVGTDQGLAEIHDVNIPGVNTSMGWSKFYNTSRSTPLMMGNTKAAWLMSDASGDLTNSTPMGTNNALHNVVGTATYGVPGVHGNAITLANNTMFCSDANNDNTCDTDADYNLVDDSFTISMWFKHSTTAPASGTDTLISKRFNTTPAAAIGQWEVWMNAGCTMQARLDDDATWSAETEITTTQTYCDNQWHYLNFSRATTDGLTTLSIDGKTIQAAGAAVTTHDGPATILTLGGDCSVGAACVTGANFWDGSIDDVVLSMAATSTGDATSHAQARKLFFEGKAALETTLVSITDATSATTTSLTKTGQTWIANELVGQFVEITGGTGGAASCIGQTRQITTNTATVLTFTPALSCTPDTSTDYEVNGEQLYGSSNVVTAIGVTDTDFLGNYRQVYVGTNNTADGGGVTVLGGFGGGIVKDLYHSDSEKTDDAASEWTGTDYDDIRSIDAKADLVIMANEAKTWTTYADTDFQEEIDTLTNKINSIRNELVVDTILGTSFEPGGLGGNDLAEYYFSSEVLEKGYLVTLDTEKTAGIKKTTSRYDNRTLGVIATAPGIILGQPAEDGYPVALAGRVPVKVTDENGSIKSGDLLTSSSTPGYAMKATEAGRVIGIAMDDLNEQTFEACPESIDPEAPTKCGSVTVFVNPHYADPEKLTATDSARLNMDAFNNLVAKVSVGAKFVWENSTGKVVAFVSDTGEALFVKVTALVGDFGKLVFGEAVVKKEAKTAGEASFAADATEVFIESDKVAEESLINLTASTKTNGLSFYIKEKKVGEGFVVALERNSGDQPNEATASATTAIKFSWFILNQE